MTRAPAPILLAFLLLATLWGGCILPGAEPTRPGELSALAVYEYRYPGDAVHHPDHPYGWMARVTNIAATPVFVGGKVLAPENVTWGPVTADGWKTSPNDRMAVPLSPGESVLFLYKAPPGAIEKPIQYWVHTLEQFQFEEYSEAWRVTEQSLFVRGVPAAAAHLPVGAADHVQTATVGVWVNGTSFYTNIAGLNEDPAFPAGYDRAQFDATPLPVYVYDEVGSEQPPGSRDTCHFVTIAGYNALLKTQAEQTTNVRFLTPEEAYTRAGNEEHFLYGDALIFMNTIVAHDGSVDTAASAPAPTGGCFNPENTVAWLPLPV